MPNNRTLLIAIGLTCFALVGAAVYMQHAKDLLPCPLCIIQRYAFLAAGAFSLAAAFAGKPKIWLGLGIASALGGLGTVGKHLYVLANPGVSCGIDPTTTFLNKLPTADWIPSVFFADGLCEDALDKVLGLSYPQWSGVWFTIVTAVLLYALVRRR
jgi:disulfide bond formation protein DsbB